MTILLSIPNSLSLFHSLPLSVCIYKWDTISWALCVCVRVCHMLNLRFTFFDKQKSNGIGLSMCTCSHSRHHTCKCKLWDIFFLFEKKTSVFMFYFSRHYFCYCLCCFSLILFTDHFRERAHLSARSPFSKKWRSVHVCAPLPLSHSISLSVSLCVCVRVCLSFLFSQRDA